jgi:NOL1/NOP2/sun family putative RNA methylase
MISISDLKTKIPEKALSLFSKTFTPSQYNKILLAIRSYRISTFRINRIKVTDSEIRSIIDGIKKIGFKIKPIEFIKDSFEFEGKINKLLNSDYVKSGKIYLQSLASMIPPLILNPEKNDNILDIASAPGSKATQISSILQNNGSIDAVEPDFTRMERLKYNANILGAVNINFIKDYGENIYKYKDKFYDKSLVDAPCSGEGRFNISDKKSYSTWKEKNINKYSNLQKKLLKSAILSTKINGIIIYSTCTLNVIENENVINSILNNKEIEVKILSIEDKFKNISESICPILKWGDHIFHPSINNALRIMPSKRIEGFFICKLKRIT